jgi:ribosomal protein S18 acetylase RimI-like enzyme
MNGGDSPKLAHGAGRNLGPVRLVRMGRQSADREVLQRVLESAPGYAVKVTGAPPAPGAAESLLASLPEGKTYQDKFVFSLHAGDQVVGCADVLRGYPAPEKATIGLLVIAESYQGRGLGAAAYAELESRIRDWGCQTIRLAVVETNDQVLGFWEKAGFQPTGERRAYTAGSVQSELLVMEKRLA